MHQCAKFGVSISKLIVCGRCVVLNCIVVAGTEFDIVLILADGCSVLFLIL